MAKKVSQPEEKEATPLEQFVEHEKNAFVEAGRALVSLVPAGLRKHGWNANRGVGQGSRVCWLEPLWTAQAT